MVVKVALGGAGEVIYTRVLAATEEDDEQNRKQGALVSCYPNSSIIDVDDKKTRKMVLAKPSLEARQDPLGFDRLFLGNRRWSLFDLGLGLRGLRCFRLGRRFG